MSPRTRRSVLGLSAASIAALAGCTSTIDVIPGGPGTGDGERDDWQYEPGDLSEADSNGGVLGSSNAQYEASADAADGGSVGLAAGGAKDANTFRRNVANDYLPIPESLSYEGLFYDYYFDTGDAGSCADLFCPTYAPAVTADPLSGETEHYVTVGLNSGLEKRDFDRKQLNLVVVLDVSGSMSSPFDEYYYDQYGNEQEVEDVGDRTKMAVAKDALASLTEQLRPGDRFGVVLYNDQSTVAKPLNPVSETDMDAIREHIQADIEANGGTNLDAGLDDATDLLAEYESADQSTYENRMIVLTDAMPNVGTTSEGGLRDRLDDAADRNLHSTFVGVGLDFNTEIVDEITSVPGANYYSVHSPDEFESRVVEGFEYMVTPLVFDLSLELDADGYEIEQVYGSTAADEATGELMHVNTLFASPTSDGETRGGVVLAKLARTADSDAAGATNGRAASELTLRASWRDRTDAESSQETTIEFPSGGPDQYANTGVRKAVALSRYADCLKNWMIAERTSDGDPPSDDVAVPNEDDHRGEWERQSDPLTVSREYRTRFGTFADYLESEMHAVDDDTLQQEIDLLETLATYDAQTIRTFTAALHDPA